MKNFTITTNQNNHILYLDGIRGIAILLVLVYHCFFDFGPAAFGWVGVDLFFILSGFLITRILVQTKSGADYFKNFFLRRALRIFPLYFMFLLIIFVLIPIIAPGILGDMSYYHQNQLWIWTYLQNWLFSLKGFPENYSLHHLWSLAVEEQFYIFWPFVIYFTPNKRLIYALLLLIILALLFRYTGYYMGFVFPFQYVHTFSRMDSLLLGGLVYILSTNAPNFLRRMAPVTLLFSVVVVLVFIIIKKSFYFWDLKSAYFFIDIFFASFLAIIISNITWATRITKALEMPILRWFGKYSYGIYLFHYPLFYICSISVLPVLYDMLKHDMLSKFANGAICILISLIMAYISFNFFENPILRLKNKIA